MQTYTITDTMTVKDLFDTYRQNCLGRIFVPNGLPGGMHAKFSNVLEHINLRTGYLRKQSDGLIQNPQDFIKGILVHGSSISNVKNSKPYIDFLVIVNETNNGTDRHESNLLPTYYPFEGNMMHNPGLIFRYITTNGILNEIDKDNPVIINALRNSATLAFNDEERFRTCLAIHKNPDSRKLVWRCNTLYNALIQ